MKYNPSRFLTRAAMAFLAVGALATTAKATPFASCITNTSGNISFYLNESGSSVTVTYEDGSTNVNFNGTTTGTNLPAGITNFSLGSHTTYTISVAKNGSGTPSLIASHAISSTGGVAANTIPTSPYFGHVYDVQRNAGVWLLNSDLSLVKSTVQTAGLGFPLSTASSTLASPDWVAIAPDGTVLVTDESQADSAVYQVAPDFSSGHLFLGPLGATNSAHGVIISPVILTGSISNGNAVLYTVDGDLGSPGSVQVYNIGSGPLPWTNAPTYQGAQISIAGFTAQALSGNEYVGFTMAPNGYIYGSTYRGSYGTANFITVMDNTGSNVLWSSEGEDGYPTTGTPPTGDWFYQTSSAAGPIGVSASAVSPDGKYIAALSVESYLVVAPLTNGIPDTSKIYTINAGASGTTYENGRGLSWDAADNIIISSSGFGTVETYNLGVLSGAAITTGTATGTTGFSYVPSPNSVSVVATTPQASQGGYNGTAGTPVPGVFTITRSSTNGYALPLTVNYTLTGTAVAGASGAYTVASTNSVVIPAGQTNVTVIITPTTANVPRLTNTVILTIAAGGYSAVPPGADTVYIQNTSSQEILLGAAAPSMYKAFSNDFASFTVTRLGDTTVPSYSVSTWTYAGTGVPNTDYTLPTNITFNPGDVKYTNSISPLVAGVPPVDTTNPVYSGNLTAIIGVAASSGSYLASNATVTLTSIDNSTPPATVLWSSQLTNAAEAASWVVTYVGGNDTTDGTNGEYEVNFGYDLTSNNPNYGFNGQANGAVAYPPSGATTCLRITCNKASQTTGDASGVNVFPITGTNFGGNYAVRFYMNLVQGANENYATEGALFGINHATKGYPTNWFGTVTETNYPGAASDGIWYWVDGQAGGDASGDFIQVTTSNVWPNLGYASLSGVFGGTFANNFKYPAPYNTYPGYGATGIPANESYNASALYNPNFLPASTWADVEIKQINNVVTLSIDKIPIFVTTNTTVWTNGVPMLGYDDPYNSIQDEDGAAFFSDIRVVAIGAPAITAVNAVKGSTNTTVKINFTTTDGDDTPSSFTLLGNGTNTVAHVDTVISGVTFTQLGIGAFQATVSSTNTAQYYRIKHN